MAQGKHNTVHKYGSGKRKRSKQLANARAKKRKSCVEVEPLTEISDNKKNQNDEYGSDSTFIYKPDKPTVSRRHVRKRSCQQWHFHLVLVVPEI